MSLLNATERLDPFRVRLRTKAMPVDGRVYASETLWEQISGDQTLSQVYNVSHLPGIVGASMAMPDAHQGYGFPIGGVAATDPARDGVVSPGGVGFDINCGVRLLATDLEAADARDRIEELLDEVFRRVPVGFKTHRRGLGKRDMGDLLEKGAAWVVARGHGTKADLAHTEEGGAYRLADPHQVSPRARERGARQLGTLGSGNHFVEIQEVSAVLDAEVAEVFGLRHGQLVVLVHTGSRGLGHQVCQDQLKLMGRAMRDHRLAMPDRQLACAPVRSEAGAAYLGAMAAAANFAWANRQVITHEVRGALQAVFGRVQAKLVYDVAHNMAKLETHAVDGEDRELCVHRKGATRAFPAGHRDIPADYAAVGQPVFIPGSMGTSSWVLVGTEAALGETWGSVCHGAGRRMSRSKAKKTTTAKAVAGQLAARGIAWRAGSKSGIVEEFPGAYKDVDEVIATVEGAGLARPVARLLPLGVVKG